MTLITIIIITIGGIALTLYGNEKRVTIALARRFKFKNKAPKAKVALSFYLLN